MKISPSDGNAELFSGWIMIDSLIKHLLPLAGVAAEEVEAEETNAPSTPFSGEELFSSDGNGGSSSGGNGSGDQSATSSDSSSVDNSIVAALTAVRRIVGRKFFSSDHFDDASDLVQTVTLRLLEWREKFRNKAEQMTDADWQSFAARSAYNEINRYFSREKRLMDFPLSEMPEAIFPQSLVGSSETEMLTLVRLVWQEICILSLRQRRALLLHSQELIIYFLESGIAHEEIAHALDFSVNEWKDIGARMPLPDFEIACLSMMKNGENKNLRLATRSIKKARFEARMRLRRNLTKR